MGRKLARCAPPRRWMRQRRSLAPDGHGDGAEGLINGVELPAGDADIGNTLQLYLRDIRRAPLFTPKKSS